MASPFRMTLIVLLAVGLSSVATAQQPDPSVDPARAERAERAERARAEAAQRAAAAAGRAPAQALTPERARALRERRAKMANEGLRGPAAQGVRVLGNRPVPNARAIRPTARRGAVAGVSPLDRLKQSIRTVENHHNRRIAQLTRIRELANEAKDTESVARVDSLIEKENRLHKANLTRINARIAQMTQAREEAAAKRREGGSR